MASAGDETARAVAVPESQDVLPDRQLKTRPTKRALFSPHATAPPNARTTGIKRAADTPILSCSVRRLRIDSSGRGKKRVATSAAVPAVVDRKRVRITENSVSWW